ncbi:hydroxymethylbilane synthase [Planifilum fulgidum]|jgi:hydroxymethylbilane synthase|uniref:Porphobilinogen deaminase n=1 Tax=Planifilum fulgidum TaxID=201973 RepID=A0A1I2MIK6_9BACL|nr:hydroxymethylbilane synthase [Bacillota bacterium]MBO2532607.1 hydroxymethylbilane synthase [Thermoactinomycetaceae bacterium]SFF90760.1 hydroxymethylbilane synthase [Planifilum fulgidum]
MGKSVKTVSVGTRQSALAQTQTRWVMDRLREFQPDWEWRMEKILTKGDRILDVTLSKIGGKGLFIKEIERALLEGRIDLAVHSMKDLPAEMPEGLVVAAVTPREDPRDCLISRTGAGLDELPAGSVVGTSSLRRQAQILARRPDLEVKPVRGNVDTRLRKLEEGRFDAVVLARAGLSRLGLEDQITEVLSFDKMLPAVGQGALAVQCRGEDASVLRLIRKINDPHAEKAVRAERAFLHAFEGGCHLPVAAYAQVEGEKVCLDGLVASPDGRRVLRDREEGNDAEAVGRRLAEKLLRLGAEEILSAVRAEVER